MPRWETGGKCTERTGVGDRWRFEVVVPGLPAYAGGGGRPRSSGTTGSAARNIAAISGGRSRLRWRAVRTTLARTCWVSAPWRVRLPPHTFADDHGGPDGLFGAPVGGVERGVPQEEEHGREFGGQVRREALGVVERRRCVDQPSEPGGESAAGRCHPVLAQCSRVAAVPQVEAGPQDRLHLAGPGTVGMSPPGAACSVGAGGSDRFGAVRRSSDTVPTRRARARRRSRSPAPWRHR